METPSLFDPTPPTAAPRAPLAHRMRPTLLEDLVGQEEILGTGKPLRQWIDGDRVPSLIFWGTPGCGKTTLARIIAERTQSHFESVSAVVGGIKDLKEAFERARRERDLRSRRTLLFVDEVHRFNRSQQDSLLPHIEDGTVTLIGATTENPSFELNAALLSRVRVIRFKPITPASLLPLLRRALQDPEQGLGGRITLTEESLVMLAEASDGDARRALTLLETVCLAPRGSSSAIEPEELRLLLERQPIRYDKDGDEHHQVVSAWIKSIRDSDPHAGLYYLARMIEGGEDPLFIARRLVILASEDVGNADPRALQVALAAKDAVDFLGFPEGRIPLAQAVTYLASAPKSNAAYAGINEAIEEVQRSGALPVPLHLRNASTSLLRAEGYGKGYAYAHDRPDGLVKQAHLPDAIRGKRFYQPKSVGLEIQIKQKLDQINSLFD